MAKLGVVLFVLAFMVLSCECLNRFEFGMSFLIDEILKEKNTLKEYLVEKLVRVYVVMARIKRKLNKIANIRKALINNHQQQQQGGIVITNFLRF